VGGAELVLGEVMFDLRGGNGGGLSVGSVSVDLHSIKEKGER
jgi:hypothetical protein